MTLQLELLRHGETVLGPCYLGRTDAPLTESGWQQMRQGLAGVAPESYQAVVSSPLQRCADFALDWTGVERLSIEPRLAEYDFGDWDGLTGEQLYARDPQALERFWQDPWRHPPPGAESLESFFSRLRSLLLELSLAYDGRVLLICHGGVIKALRCIVLGLPVEQMFEYGVAHGSLHRLPGAGS